MDVRALLGVLRKFWGSILALTVLGGLLAAAYVVITTPVYTAQSQVLLSGQGGQTNSDVLQGTTYANTVARTWAAVATSPFVLDQTIANVGLNTTSQNLAKHVTTAIPTNTSIINIAATDGSPAQAAAIAQGVADALVSRVDEQSPRDANDRPTLRATVITPAIVPTSPTSPKLALTIALGLIAGLAIGIGQAVLRTTLDVSIRTESDVAKATDHSVLARIPFSSTMGKSPIAIVNDPQSPVAEEFRRLRTNLAFLSMDNKQAPVYVVTSSLPEEGKTVTSINIAFGFAEDDQRVLLIDGDLRRPKVASYLHLEGSVGLTTVLVGKARLDDVIQRLGPGHIDVLPLGAIPPNPVEMAGSDAMRRLLVQAVVNYDVVVIDSAPLLPVADTILLASLATGTLIVAGGGRVKIPQLRDAIESVEHGNAAVLGVILNLTRGHGGNGYYRASYYGYSYDNGKHPKTTKSVYRRVGAASRRGTAV